MKVKGNKLFISAVLKAQQKVLAIRCEIMVAPEPY
jgi:hypothetical protein